jgi:hypothetical protein
MRLALKRTRHFHGNGLDYYNDFAIVTCIALGTAILLLPALIIGRPFIFWDTPTFYSWGHDILAAIRHPWPPLSHFPSHRGLWAADNMPGAWDRITSPQFQLVMTSIGARSKFYAVPLYALGSTLTLWAPALIQSALVAWALWITVATLLPRAHPAAYLALVGALTIGTTAPLYAAFLMPDIFAPLGLLAATLLLCFSDRLTPGQRIGCASLVAVATLVHTSNGAVLIVLLGTGIVTSRLSFSRVPVKRGALLVGAALLTAAAIGLVSDAGMRAIFGEPIRTAPFLEGRVIADGPGREFLREACPRHPYAACRYKDAHVANPDDIIWPDVGAQDLPRINDPAERHRYLDEQKAIVLGALTHHPIEQLRASAKNAVKALLNFRIAGTLGNSLIGLLLANSDRTFRVRQIVPDLKPCLASPRAAACDYTRALRVLQVVHSVVVAVSYLILALRLLHWFRAWVAGAMDQEARRLVAFTLILVGAVIMNAVLCGTLSGPFERYQARVIWLVPMLAMVMEATVWRRRGSAPMLKGTLP